MPSFDSPEYSAKVLFQGESSLRDVGLIYVAGSGLVFGLCAWLGVPTSHYGLVFLGALAISSVLVMVSYDKLKARSRRVAVVSFTPPVLSVPDREPLDLSGAHSLCFVEHEGRVFMCIRTPHFADIGLGGISRKEAEAAFEAPWLVESISYAPSVHLTIDLDHIEFSRALIAEAGRNRMVNQTFAIWSSYPWDTPYEPRPLPPEATPATLPEPVAWPDREIGVSASYIFFREEQQWQFFPLGDGLEVSLETDSSIFSGQAGTPVKYVYVQLRSPRMQARICMKDSGSINEGAIFADTRRAFVAFVNSRSHLGSSRTDGPG